MKKLTWQEFSNMVDNLKDYIGYMTDNSCGDPDCCGGPYYDESDRNRGLAALEKLGIEVEDPFY